MEGTSPVVNKMFIPEQEKCVRVFVYRSPRTSSHLCFGQGFFCMYKKRYISLFFAIFVIVGAVVFFALSDDRAPVAQEIAVTKTPAVVEQVSQNIPKQKETTGPDRPQAEREKTWRLMHQW